MERVLRIFLFALLICFRASNISAQMFEASADWDDDEKTIVIGKWSQLYYELNVGWNISDSYTSQANFIYFGAGVGTPVNTKNAWRKFLPKQQIPDDESEAELFGSMDTKDVYGGKLGMGWIHYFNHSVGFYTQLSWGFLADFGSPDDSAVNGTDDKKTFIYNTAPLELGLCLNCWKHLHLQCGATYMWKEIPLLTAGVGTNF